MSARDNDPLHIAINSKLAIIVKSLPEPPAWYEAWSHLGPESTKWKGSPSIKRFAIFFKDGDVVVMIGDSITEQHLYSNYVEMWTITRFPN